MTYDIYSTCPACFTELGPEACNSYRETDEIEFFVTCHDCGLQFVVSANRNAFNIAQKFSGTDKPKANNSIERPEPVI